MTIPVTTRLTRLTERLAWHQGQAEEWHRHLLATEPYTSDHVRCHGRWVAHRECAELLKDLISEEKGD